MEIVFTVQQFFDVFGTYNTTIWSAHVLAYLLGILALAIAIRETILSARIVSGILTFFWIWMGVFYIVQDLLLLLIGTIHDRLAIRFSLKTFPTIGDASFFTRWLSTQSRVSAWIIFTPKPQCLASLRARRRFSFLEYCFGQQNQCLPIILLLCSIVGMSAALNLRIPQDYGLVIAGVLGMIMIMIQNHRTKMMA